MPALGKLVQVDLLAQDQSQVPVEYELHNLSDANAILVRLAPEFGYDPADTTTYNTRFRNPALANLSGKRVLILYGPDGLDATSRPIRRPSRCVNVRTRRKRPTLPKATELQR